MKDILLAILIGLALLVSVGVTAQRTLIQHKFETVTPITSE
jgi:hypothetical protein